MSDFKLYMLAGIAFRPGSFSAVQVARMDKSLDAATGYIHRYVREQYPASEGYVQYHIMATPISQAMVPGYEMDVTIEEPAP